MSIGSLKPGGVWADARVCSGGGDVGGPSVVLNTPGNVGAVDDEQLNQACSAAGLLRDSNSKLYAYTRLTSK